MDKTLGFGRDITRRTARESTTSDKIYVDTSIGLTDAEVEESKSRFGRNTFTEKKRRGFFSEFLKNLSDPIIRVLIGAMVINVVFTLRDVNWVEIGGIALTVMIATLVSTVSEFSSGAAYEKLFKSVNEHRHTVIRNGERRNVSVSDIVRLDVVELSAGELVPCDGILLSGELSCDQSALTGESKALLKTPMTINNITEEEIRAVADPGNAVWLSRGASVISGDGVMLACAVGDSTFYGGIASGLQEDALPSPLKTRLCSLARTISRLGYIGAVIVAAAYLINVFLLGDGISPLLVGDYRYIANELLHALTLAVSIVVVAVPEGLPMMITVVLSANMKKMMHHGVLVRKLVGIETAGSLSILFTDKTGTITTGQMTVMRILTSDGEYTNSLSHSIPTPISELISVGARFCSGKGSGNMTDRAIERIIDKRKGSSYDLIDRIPFDSKYKYAAVKLRRCDGHMITVVRGAPEIISAFCSYSMHSDGNTSKGRIEYSATDGLRCISQAVGSGDAFDILKAGQYPTDMTEVCVFCIKDEVREAVRDAVRMCSSAGVSVVMLTGDSEKTAETVAVDAGILPKRHQIYSAATETVHGVKLLLKSSDLHVMTDEVLRDILPDLAVISRATPADKTRLVRVAAGAGHVVGMTGDGVNDAPALKAADVGFAMGSGTDAAREAGDIVISDDNFVSITRAILYGRSIFQSIRKFILFQLTMNVCAVGVSLISPFFGYEAPITITQMLWINIIMDTLGSLAFAAEPARYEYMKRPPIRRDERILNKDMIRRIILGGLYTLSLCMYFLISEQMHYVFNRGDETYYLTVFFALFVFCGIANSFCARSERLNPAAGLSKNKIFVFIMLLVAAVQLLMIYFGGEVFRTVPLCKDELMLAGAMAMTVFPADLIFKASAIRMRGKKRP